MNEDPVGDSIEDLVPRFRRIAKAMVLINVENREAEPPHRFTVFSGFVAEVENYWFWVTADHVLDEEELGLDYTIGKKQFVLTIKPLLSQAKDRQVYVHRYERSIRLSKIAQDSLKGDEPSEWAAMAERLDLGAIHLSEYHVEHLRSVGVLPLSGHEIDGSDESLKVLKSPDLRIDLVGAPRNGIAQGLSNCTADIKILDVRTHHYTPPFLYFQPDWGEREHSGSLVGFSGGPIVATTEHQTILCAVQSTYLPQENLLRAVDPRVLFDMIKMAIDLNPANSPSPYVQEI